MSDPPVGGLRPQPSKVADEQSRFQRASDGFGAGPESDEVDAFGLARRSWSWRKETTKVGSAAQNPQSQVRTKRLDGRDEPREYSEIPATSSGASGNPPGETQGKTQVDHER